MPLLACLKCCARAEENQSSKQLVPSSHGIIDSEVPEILPSNISRTVLPPKREAIELPTPQEAQKINLEILRAMDNYRDRINAQHIHQFLKFSFKKPRQAVPPGNTASLKHSLSQRKSQDKTSAAVDKSERMQEQMNVLNQPSVNPGSGGLLVEKIS